MAADRIRAHRALAARTGDVFCLESNDKPLEKFKQVDDLVSSWT